MPPESLATALVTPMDRRVWWELQGRKERLPQGPRAQEMKWHLYVSLGCGCALRPGRGPRLCVQLLLQLASKLLVCTQLSNEALTFYLALSMVRGARVAAVYCPAFKI